ncbi:phosphatase PAP2 family protein [Legionella lytica]|uniref:Phosphatase PAP2 family protein n=1 Tax=Legionella lytica TaxID=96232 RepID=A0ABY4Y4S2_9GAMM|nr:phosphatase PAP2 family protein [Legionella lytica]USQ12603.1 phosphatase PAP2 family protein [Legionella lytica]
MRQVSSRCISSLAGFILFFSFIALFINYFIYQFPGNNYFPDNVVPFGIFLVLLNLGLHLSFAKDSKACQIGNELIYFFVVMAIIAMATNAVQLTPFPIIDQYIVTLEARVGIDTSSIVSWTNAHPQFKALLSTIYDSLAYQMSIIPLLVLFSCRFHLLREYYFLLLCTVLLGFAFYYFFPTAAPASIFNHALFDSSQIATGLKFSELHHHIVPTTNEGGLIALPSFHAIWAILCVNLLREWPIACIVLAVINVMLIASCVLLGWHYSTDILGSLIVLFISYFALKYCSHK